MAVSGEYGGPGTEYRTRVDSFARIESGGAAGAGPASFEVRARDGLIRSYGYRSDSRIEAEGREEVGTWALDEVRDRSGNYYRLYYAEDSAEGSYRISRIEYTGNQNTGAAPGHTVDFDYEARADNPLHFRGGSRLRRHPLRLAGIRISHDGQLLHHYRLSYESVGVDSRSRLTRIERCDAAATCQDPISLSWWDDGQPRTTLKRYEMPFTNMWGDRFNTQVWHYTTSGAPRWHDVNGDGTADYVLPVPNGAGAYNAGPLPFNVRLSGPGGYTDQTWYSELQDAPENFTWVDLDGDGLTDALDHNCTGIFACDQWELEVAFSTGSGFSMARWDLPNREGRRFYRDMNGDGLPDLAIIAITTSVPINPPHQFRFYHGLFVYLNTGAGFGPEEIWLQDKNSLELADMNGDGLADVIWDDRYVLFNRNGSPAETVDFGAPSYPFGSYFVDYNGDGLPDRHGRDSDGSCCVLDWNTGAGFAYAGPALHAVNSDFDANGLGDRFARTVAVFSQETQIKRWLARDDRGADYEEQLELYPPGQEYLFQVADLNGDGFPDYALADAWMCHNGVYGRETCESNYHSVVEHQGMPLNLLKSITEGQGLETLFNYRPLTDHSVYEKGTGAARPVVDVQDGTWVATEKLHSDGVGGHFSITYRYAGLRRDTSGSGSLGFARITTKDHRRNRTTITEYAQTFPYASEPLRVDVLRTSDGHLLKRTENQYSVTGSTAPFNSLFPYLAESLVTTWDPDTSVLLSTTTLRNLQVDAMGNIGLTETEVSDHGIGLTHLTRTQTDFSVDGSSAWVPGLPVRRVTSRWLNGSSSLPGGLVTAFTHDPTTGLLLSVTRQPGGGTGVELTTNYVIDAHGNIISETVAGPGISTRTRTIGYDQRGQYPLESTNPLGHVTRWTWSAATGDQLSETDPNGLITHWDYDSFGRTIRESRPDGSSSESGWYLDRGWDNGSAVWYRETRSTGVGPVRVFFDLLGREVRSRSRGFLGEFVHRDTRYDSAGRVAAVSEPYFSGHSVPWNSTQYDSTGRISAFIAADPALSNTTRYAGFDTVVTDALGRETTRQLNALGQVISTIDAYGTGLSMAYDSQGNRVRVTAAALSSSQSSVHYSFDPLGRLISQDDPDHGVYHWTYDALGQKISERSPAMTAGGELTTYRYDVLGRLIRRISPEGKTLWNYDYTRRGNLGLGRLHRETQSGFTRIHKYAPLRLRAAHQHADAHRRRALR